MQALPASKSISSEPSLAVLTAKATECDIITVDPEVQYADGPVKEFIVASAATTTKAEAPKAKETWGVFAKRIITLDF